MKCYMVDAFAEKVFEGNPAGVCILEQELPEALMQSIAAENNLSETAFAVKGQEGYRLRWFTPGGEIDLCGHATLATAFVLANFYKTEATTFTFETLSGTLTVTRQGERYELDFPAIPTVAYSVTPEMVEALGATPVAAYIGRDPVFVLDSAEAVGSLSPDFGKIKALPDGLAAFVTAADDSFDFVARAFWPKLGVNEDPVCGSIFCSLTPLWAARLGREEMVARQLSKRGGTVHLKNCGQRVRMSGTAVLYAISELQL